jgi:hypothetical protein
MGDSSTAAACDAALAKATRTVVDPSLLWNASHGFFRCHTDVTWHSCVKISSDHPTSSEGVGAASGAGASVTHHATLYEHRLGFLARGDDVRAPINATSSGCRHACDTNSSCSTFCFASDDACPNSPVLCYLKSSVHFSPHTPSKEQIMTDTLYGEMLSHHHFDGTFGVDESLLRRHLAFEMAANHDTYGMRVLCVHSRHRPQPPPPQLVPAWHPCAHKAALRREIAFAAAQLQPCPGGLGVDERAADLVVLAARAGQPVA